MRGNKIRFGVISASGMAELHMSAIAANKAAELIAICDIDAEKAKTVAEKFSVDHWYTDYREMLTNPDIDAVVVCTPDTLHMEMSVAALHAGKHVLCEKPMVMTLEECRTMMDEAAQSEKKFMVGQICRYAPGFQMTKQLIDAGEIGELYFVESEYAHDYEKRRGANDWRCDPSRPREPFLGGGCHSLDLLRWIAGDPYEVSAYSTHKMLTDWPVDDTTIAILRFPNRVIGKVLVSIGCKRDYTMRSAFYGTKGTIIADNTSNYLTLYKANSMEHVSDKIDRAPYEIPIRIPVDISNHNTMAEISELIDCIKKDKPVATSAKEGAYTVAACLCAAESAKTGKGVKISYQFDQLATSVENNSDDLYEKVALA